MLRRAEPWSRLGINQHRGAVGTSKGSAGCWEALKQILKAGWKIILSQWEWVSLGVWGERWVLGNPHTCVCIALRWEGMWTTRSALAPLSTSKRGIGRLKPAVTPDWEKRSLQQPLNC